MTVADMLAGLAHLRKPADELPTPAVPLPAKPWLGLGAPYVCRRCDVYGVLTAELTCWACLTPDSLERR